MPQFFQHSFSLPFLGNFPVSRSFHLLVWLPTDSSASKYPVLFFENLKEYIHAILHISRILFLTLAY